jgi:hypothetical protein
MRIVSLLVGLLMLLTATPVAAGNDDRDNEWSGNWHQEGRKHRANQNNNDRDNDDQDNDDQDNDGQKHNGRGTWVSVSNDGRDCWEGRDDDNDNDDDNQDGTWGGWSQQVSFEWGQGCQQGRRGVFKNRGDGMSDDQADALSDVLQECVSSENFWDLRWGQIWQIVHTVGLTERERQRIRDLGDLAEALQDQLDENNIEDLKFRQILQVSHACGLSTRDVVSILWSA